jgi:hypothetical protein
MLAQYRSKIPEAKVSLVLKTDEHHWTRRVRGRSRQLDLGTREAE